MSEHGSTDFREEDFHDRTNIMGRELRRHGFIEEKSISNLLLSRILIFVNTNSLTTKFGEAAVIMVANQVARVFKNIDFFISSSIDAILKEYPLFSGQGIPAKNRLNAGLKRVNKWGDFKMIHSLAEIKQRASKKKYTYAICIGKTDDANAKLLQESVDHVLYFTAHGWRAFLSPNAHDLPSISINDLNARASTIGAMLGAILAVNDGIKHVLQMQKAMFVDKLTTFSAFDYSMDGSEPGPELPEKIDAGTIVVTGLGAVGGILVAMLPLLRTPFSGHARLIDFDVLEIHNMNRTLYATIEDMGNRKAEVAMKFLKLVPWLSNLFVDAEYTTLEKATIFDEKNVDIALALVDSGDSRRNLQDKLPKSIIHAGTTEFQVEVFTCENLLHDACLKCVFDQADHLWDDAKSILITRLEKEKGKGNVLPSDVTQDKIKAVADEIILWKVNAEKEQGRPVPMYLAVATVAGIKILQYPGVTDELLKLHNVKVPVPTLPPVSALPALLCLGEVIKLRHFPQARLNNRWQTDLIGKIDYSFKITFPKNPKCSCNNEDYRELYKEAHGLQSTS
nr:ThiF family adenylyltransferase [Candidatus Sigynarchaeota archaeon]